MGSARQDTLGDQLHLIKRAIGDRQAIRGKLARTAFAIGNYLDYSRVETRLAALRDLGYLDTVPNRTQLVGGTVDMLRFFMAARADYHERQDHLSFRFHLLLRILEDPSIFLDPTGFVSHQDTIIGHVMRIVHCDPIYDLQVLAAIPGGLEELERQLEQMLEGTHPRHDSIATMMEDPTYYERLLAYVREFRADPHGCGRMLRDNIVDNPEYSQMTETFGDLPSTMAYFATMPDKPWKALRRLFETQRTSVRTQSNPEPAANDTDGQARSKAA